MNEVIKEYVAEICERLSIRMPKITIGGKLPTKTMLAACSSDGEEIVLQYGNVNLDAIFAIAHELRHAWQIRTAEGEYTDGYRDSSELGIEDYNLQPAELDANAFAALIMIEFFGVYPKFNGLPETVKEKIIERMNEIAE